MHLGKSYKFLIKKPIYCPRAIDFAFFSESSPLKFAAGGLLLLSENGMVQYFDQLYVDHLALNCALNEFENHGP